MESHLLFHGLPSRKLLPRATISYIITVSRRGGTSRAPASREPLPDKRRRRLARGAREVPPLRETTDIQENKAC